MNTETLRKAVEYADGWVASRLGDQRIKVLVPHGRGGQFPLCDIGYLDEKWVQAALASQLISQVLSTGFDFSSETQGAHFEAPGQWIAIHDPVKSETHRFERDARNGYDENSIEVCVQFFEAEDKT